jgi:hypothetical protein
MKLQKIFVIIFILLTIVGVVVEPSFSQVKKDEIISFPGIIESIDKNFKFIIVNEARIFISNETKIVDEKGNVLKINDLKPKLSVTIEALRNPDGFFAKKILVRTLGKKS